MCTVHCSTSIHWVTVFVFQWIQMVVTIASENHQHQIRWPPAPILPPTHLNNATLHYNMMVLVMSNIWSQNSSKAAIMFGTLYLHCWPQLAHSHHYWTLYPSSSIAGKYRDTDTGGKLQKIFCPYLLQSSGHRQQWFIHLSPKEINFIIIQYFFFDWTESPVGANVCV